MSNHASRLPFTPSDAACLRSRFTMARTRRKYICDIEVAEVAEAASGWQADGSGDGSGDGLGKGIVWLSSRNLGYDFALVHVRAGKGLFGAPRSAVEIYVKYRGDDRYFLLRVAPSLAKALAVIDRIYDDAARRHLP